MRRDIRLPTRGNVRENIARVGGLIDSRVSGTDV